MAKARPIPDLSADDAYAVAAAKVVAVRREELHDLSANVLDTAEIERLHDMRVATRRLRAALEIFEAVFPKRKFKRVLREVKALADALGERRDRDVTIEALASFSEQIGRSDRPGVQSLIAEMRDEQQQANKALAPYVERKRLETLNERIGELIAAVEQFAAAADSPQESDS